MNQRSFNVLEFHKIIDLLKDECQSDLGLIEADRLTPTANMPSILQWQNETSEAEGLVINKGPAALTGLQNISGLVKKAEVGSTLDPGQLLLIKRQLTLAKQCKKFIDSFGQKETIPTIDGLSKQIFPVPTLESRLEESILSDTELSDAASPELKQIRRQIIQKNENIRSKLNQMIQSVKMQKFLQEALVTVRGSRYVLPVKQEYRSMVPGLVHDQSSTGATLFIEPMAVVELNNQLRELKNKEKYEIERILMELTREVMEVAAHLYSNQHMMQTLDFLMAKGKLAVKMKAIKPVISENHSVVLKNARHPLLPSKQVVPISLELGKEFKALVVTGPNTGGKTVTLKTAGTLVLMAQSGLHIPADEGSIIGIFDQVFADIGDEQSIEQSLSTFSSHMTNIVEILKQTTSNSLVLLDELGAGTDPDEGAALAMAILDHLLQTSASVMATTHYSELKQYALMNPSTENACVEFDVETLSPTYKLLIGVPGKSNAFEISGKLGLSREIIENARTFLTQESIAFEDVLMQIDKNKKETDQQLKEATAEKRIADQMISEAKVKQKKLDEQRERILKEARTEAQQLIKNTKAEIDHVMNELKKIQKMQQNNTALKDMDSLRTRLREEMNHIGEPEGIVLDSADSMQDHADILQPGDDVRIPSLNQAGTILGIDRNQGQAQVQVGVMKMSLPLSGLQKDENKMKEMRKNTERIIQIKTDAGKPDIDLRGLDLEEARYALDKFLDDAYMSGRKEVTVIHGIGTGILKKGIQGMLKKHRHVKRYRDGQYGEGGAGVTIVVFKDI